MDLVPSDDQEAIVETVGQYLAKARSLPQLRERLRGERTIERSAWTGAGNIGVFSLGLPESSGGSGLPSTEEALVFRELGRHLAPVGFLASVLAGRLADRAGADELRDAVADGSAPVGLGLVRSSGGLGEGTVTGRVEVFDLPAVDHVVLVERDGRLALVAASELGRGAEVPCVDPSTTLTRLEVQGVTPTIVPDQVDAEDIVLLGALLATAMLVGVAEATRDMSVSYAKERVQFGRPIGVNQAIKHRCADMGVRCEAASSLLFFAAVALRDRRDDAAFQVAAAKRIASDAARANSRANVQIHGGMGYTWEHDAHLYVSRTHVLDHLFGDGVTQRDAVLNQAPAPL